MRVKYSPLFLAKLKKVDVRIRKSLREKIAIFIKNPNDPELDNHPLRDEYLGGRGIDITADWRAVYEEIEEGDNTTAYFETFGTHDELFRKPLKTN